MTAASSRAAAAADKRRQILDAAIRVFATRGFHSHHPVLNRIRSANRAAVMDSQQCLPDRQVVHTAKLNRAHWYLQKLLAADRRPSGCTFGGTASERAGFCASVRIVISPVPGSDS